MRLGINSSWPHGPPPSFRDLSLSRDSLTHAALLARRRRSLLQPRRLLAGRCTSILLSPPIHTRYAVVVGSTILTGKVSADVLIVGISSKTRY